MTERAFVLAPLAEIAPNRLIGERTVSERLAAIDSAGIEKLPGGQGWWKG
jgi:2-amino-4-hydroxy-6-hydroxymethyldihydropteridine diphosphokinase